MRAIVFQLILCLLVAPLASHATPDPGSWRRTVVLGDTPTDAFLLRSEWSQPGSYYASNEKIFLVRNRLVDWSAQETWLLRQVAYLRDTGTLEEKMTEADSSSVDLAEILRTFKVRPVFPESWPEFGIDSKGVWTVVNDKRLVVVPTDELQERIPDLNWGEPSMPSIVRVDKTNGWAHGQGFYYLTVRSGACAGDVNWFEDILAVPEQTILDPLKAAPQEAQHK